MILMGYLAFFDAPKRTRGPVHCRAEEHCRSGQILTGDHRQSPARSASGSASTQTTYSPAQSWTACPIWSCAPPAGKTAAFARLSPGRRCGSWKLCGKAATPWAFWAAA